MNITEAMYNNKLRDIIRREIKLVLEADEVAATPEPSKRIKASGYKKQAWSQVFANQAAYDMWKKRNDAQRNDMLKITVTKTEVI